MEKRLIATLLRIVQSPKSDFPAGVGLRDFRQRYGIGLPVGSTSIRFSDKDKVEITALLKAQAGIDPSQVSPGAWEGLTRAQALNLAHDEKLARGAVKNDPVLTEIGVSADEAAAERGAMQRWAVGKTANRRVLGSLNDLAFQLQVGLLNFPDRTLTAQSLWLAKTPLKVIDYGAPDQATLAAFAAHRALQAAIGR